MQSKSRLLAACFCCALGFESIGVLVKINPHGDGGRQKQHRGDGKGPFFVFESVEMPAAETATKKTPNNIDVCPFPALPHCVSCRPASRGRLTLLEKAMEYLYSM